MLMRLTVLFNLLLFSGGLAAFSLTPKFSTDHDEVRISAIHQFDKIDLAKPGVSKVQFFGKEPFVPPVTLVFPDSPEVRQKDGAAVQFACSGAPLGLTIRKCIFPFHSFL